MLKQVPSGESVNLEQTVDPIAVPNPRSVPVDRGALVARLREKFDAQLMEMHSEAQQHDALPLLADRLTLELAINIVSYGSGAVGDILKFLGENVLLLIQHRNAETEAQAAKEQGKRAH